MGKTSTLPTESLCKCKHLKKEQAGGRKSSYFFMECGVERTCFFQALCLQLAYENLHTYLGEVGGREAVKLHRWQCISYRTELQKIYHPQKKAKEQCSGPFLENYLLGYNSTVHEKLPRTPSPVYTFLYLSAVLFLQLFCRAAEQ